MNRQTLPSGGRREDLPQAESGPRMTAPAHVPHTHSLPPTVSRHSDTKAYPAYAKSITRPIAPAPVNPSPIATSSGSVMTAIPAVQPGLGNINTDVSRIQTMTAITTAVHPPRMVHPTATSTSQPSIVSIATVPSSTVTQPLNVPHVPLNVGPIIPRVTHNTPTFPPHLPRGAVAASALSAPKSASAMTILRPNQPSALQMPAATTSQTAVHPLIQSQIQNRASLISQAIRPGTPPNARSTSPSLTVPSQLPAGEGHRLTVPVQTSMTPVSTPNIQITLHAPRPIEIPKPIITHAQPKSVHITQGASSQSKVIMSQAAVTPMLHSNIATLQKAAAKVAAIPSTTAPLSLSSPVISALPAPAVTTVTVSPSTVTPNSSSIPVAKVQPQRQQQATSVPLPPSAPVPSQDHSQVDLNPHLPGLAGQQTQSSALFSIPQAHRAPPSTTALTTTASIPSSAAHSDVRTDRLTIPPYMPIPYQLSQLYPDQHYAPFLYPQMAQAQSLRTGLLPSPTPNLAATLQAAAHGISANTGQPVRFNPMMVTVQDSVRHPKTLNLHTQYTTATTTGDNRKATAKGPISSTVVSDATVMSIASIPVQASLSSVSTLATAASLYSSVRPTTPPSMITTQQPTTPHSGSSNPNNSMSPRPSILRKRTSDGAVVVKKPFGLFSERHSPRPEAKADSTPQSNTSSPKTPATPAGESQSSTDTALSSEATTPTQNSQSDVKVKQEPPDLHENGSLPNSVEASPRKKPRKQLLNAAEELKDSMSTDDELERLAALEEKLRDIKQELKDGNEYIDNEGIRWSLEKKRPPVTLLMNFYNISWKPRNNHFSRYTDVKPKEERRPTVNELSNQRGIVQKASGWKLYHMAAQMEDLVELEKTLCSSLSDVQTSIAPRPSSKPSVMEDDAGLLHELSQGNIQRCQLITNQLEEARTSMLKVLDHRQRIYDIINKHMSKRPIKKKERT